LYALLATALIALSSIFLVALSQLNNPSQIGAGNEIQINGNEKVTCSWQNDACQCLGTNGKKQENLPMKWLGITEDNCNNHDIKQFLNVFLGVWIFFLICICCCACDAFRAGMIITKSISLPASNIAIFNLTGMSLCSDPYFTEPPVQAVGQPIVAQPYGQQVPMVPQGNVDRV
jgi:hypothetical protein